MNTKIDINRFDPCYEGREYYKSKASFEEAWNDCGRGDWMLWIAARLEIDRRLLVKAAALCAGTVRHLMKDKRSTDAIDACFRYAAGEIDDNELGKYASAADSVTNVSTDAARSAYYAAYAAYAAYYAAYAAADAARDAAAADAAYSDTDAALVALVAASAARAANRLLTANICREQLTQAVMEKVKNY
jgi:hypothetical protein